MMMTRIQVKKLYGLHNYDISFKEDECVKIIHAPNGFGKTTILRLVRAMMEGCLHELQSVPFESFKIDFDCLLSIEAVKQQQEITYVIKDEKGLWTYHLGSEAESGQLMERIKELQIKIPIYFIDADRLWIEKDHYNENGRELIPTVLEYAKELSEWMREALAQSNFCGQQLDRSFPARMVQFVEDPSVQCLTPERIQEELEKLEKKRSVLEGAGLFSPMTEPLPAHLEHLDETMLKVLMLYIEDSKEKLKVFESLATKINLLSSLINKRFSYKVMEVNMKDGFIFKVPTNERLKADKLSSGEQNELILMFMLLFKAPADALILMDEPEISLHIAWQQSFLEDMERIASLSEIRMLIATHSPDIINGRWDLTTGLEEGI